MESIQYDLNFLAGEPQSNCLVRGDQMDCGTLANLSDDAFLPNVICKGSDLFLFNPPSPNTTTNRESISSLNPLLSEPHVASQDSGFSLDRKLYSSPSYADVDFYSIEKYLSDEHVFPTSLLNCGNLSPLSHEDVESILDTTSLSDDGDVSLGSPPPPSSPDLPLSLTCEEIPLVPASSSPPLFHHVVNHANDSDGIVIPNSILDVSVSALGQPPTPEGTSRSSSPSSMVSLDLSSFGHATSPLEMSPQGYSPSSLVSGPGKEKRPKSYRTTKKTPYTCAQSTASIHSPIDDDNILEIPQQLSKKEKKKLQNKNAATRYRQKMKEESELRKMEEDELLKENTRLKNKVEEIQKEIQYLKNLQREIGLVRMKTE